MNCIYCHAQLELMEGFSWIRCADCNVWYGGSILPKLNLAIINYVDIVVHDHNIGGKEKSMLIDVRQSTVNLNYNFKTFYSVPLTWLFLSNVKEFYNKFYELRHFL